MTKVIAIKNPEEEINRMDSKDNTPQPDSSDENISPQSNDTQKPVSKQTPEIAFTLTIKNKNINVLFGVDEKTLKKAPGWLTSSVLPNEIGMCVVYGHRNNRHLRILEQVKIGDEIVATMPDGSSYSYAVTEIQIVDTNELQLPIINGNSLVLITCYPFRYSGNAPRKYVVISQIQDITIYPD